MPAPKSIILHGGRKARRVATITRVERLGGGYEGNVYSAKSELRKGQRIKRKIFALKSFFGYGKNTGNFGNPLPQFLLLQELKKLNKEKNLGLNLPTTIRLRKIRQDKTSYSYPEHELIMTKLNVVKLESLSKEEKQQFWKDAQRQQQIALNEGFRIKMDSFECIFDKKTKKYIAMIVDFGNITKIRQETAQKLV